MGASQHLVTQADVFVRLLGPPGIFRDGERVPLDTRKAIALLAYLAETGRPQSRDGLAALLWPDADQTRSRSALRRTLSTLNAALGSGLRIERESLAFTGAGLLVDIEAFRKAARSDDVDQWRTATSLYNGDFLAGFVIKDNADFEEWQLATADGFRRDFARVLERLVSALRDNEPDAAIDHARRWIDLDPLHEPAHRAVMECYARSGDRAAALRQYREVVAILERELGVEPLEETTELYESIRESRTPHLVEASAKAAPPPVVAQLPIVGRAAEFASLISTFDAVGPDGRLVVVDGEPGIGKTRLASEFAAHLEQRGATVLFARSHPEEQKMAFGTVVELLRAIGGDRLPAISADARREASRLLPAMHADPSPSSTGPSAIARRRLFESVVEVLTTGALSEGPGAIMIDDVQWIDESSLDVLRFCVRRLRGRPVLVLLTWRAEEVPPADPRRRMLADAQRDGLSTAITLQRLNREQVTELVGHALTSQDRAEALFESTAGVPFFVVEYLKGNTRGELLPEGVRDLMASRLESVSATATQVLAAAAVLGHGFDPVTVRATSGRTPDEVVAALDELTEHGLVTEAGESYDFTHPKLREYVYDNSTLGRRRLLHARAAKAIVRRVHRRPELAAVAAHHFERAGDEEAAADLFEQAAGHAISVYANAEALEHMRSALALGHPDTARLHERIGDLLTLDGAYRDAIASYEKAAALGAEIGAIATKLGGVHHRLGDWSSAEAHYLEAAEAAEGTGTPPGRARLLADRSLNAHRDDRPTDARELAALALQVASEEHDPASLSQAHNISGILAARRGDAQTAIEHLEASLRIAERAGDHASIAAALNNLALTLREQGQHETALSQAERALELCRRIGDRHREAAVLSNIADIQRALGRTEEALENVKRSAVILAEVGEPGEQHPEIWKLTAW